MAPLFSVILPTYNRAAMLRTALWSVAAQSFTDFECFVLDDGSTDVTPQVFEEFSGRRCFEFVRFEENRRQHVCRNWALARASGDFIAFLDSDDIWLPERLEVFAAAIRSRAEPDFWFSNAWLWRDGRILGTLFESEARLSEGRVPGWMAVGHPQLPYVTTNLALRRTLFEKVGRFREDMRILEDTELYARMLASGARVGAIRRPLAVRRLHPGQITHDYRLDYREALMALEAGGAAADVLAQEKKRLALSVAGYFLKSLQQRTAREFLVQELGDAAQDSLWFKLSFLPSWVLAGGKALRRLGLAILRHPAWASAPVREVYRFIDPLLTQEMVSSRAQKSEAERMRLSGSG